MPHQSNLYDTDPSYLGNDSTDVVSGRRIANFFGLDDPNLTGTDTLAHTRLALRKMPELLDSVLAHAAPPGEGVSPQQEASIITLERNASALVEWLCGDTTRNCAELAGIDDSHFSDWVHNDARSMIGSQAVYSTLVEALP